MNEGDVRREIYQMLRYRYDLWPDHFADIPGVKDQPGRPDLVVMNPRGPGHYVEVKALDLSRATSFSFSSISDNQRRWLEKWEDVCPFGAWFGLGTVGHRPRELYLVPWSHWVSIEGQLTPYQNSLPYEVGPGYLTELQEQQLDFRLLKRYRCGRVPASGRLPGESGWRISPALEYIWLR